MKPAAKRTATWAAALTMLLFVIGTVYGAERQYSGDDAAQDIWLLENGPQETWIPAMRRLIAEQRLRGTAVASVLRRIEVLDARERKSLARALGSATRDRRALDALLALARESDIEVRQAARATLLERANQLPLDLLLRLAAQQGDRQRDFLRSWQHRYTEAAGLLRSPRAAAVLAQAQQLRDEGSFPILASLAADSGDVASTATEALGLLLDARVEDELWRLFRAGNDAALLQLARRGDPRAVEPLVARSRRTAAEAKTEFDHRRALASAGRILSPVLFPRLVSLYRAAGDGAARRQLESMIDGHLSIDLLDEPQAMQELRTLARDPDAFLRATARKVLAWNASRESDRAAPRHWLVAASLAGIVLGVCIYLLAFRLLMLKRFVQRLPVQKIRSAPVGLVALQGKVLAHAEQFTSHPMTGENCVVFEQARYPFWLDDGTGRILVDAQGAALLSEDGMLVPGEKVLVVGTLRQGVPAGESSVQRYMARRDQDLTWFTRATGWIVRAATGMFLGQNSARMMFLNERLCFWIWDDLDERPFLAERETSGMSAGLLFAGAWILAFVGAVLGISPA